MDMSKFDPPPPILTCTLIQKMKHQEFVGKIVDADIKTFKNQWDLEEKKQRKSIEQPVVIVKSEKDSLLYMLVFNPEMRKVLWDRDGSESNDWLGTRIIVNVIE
jgi:hypothetical protein